jgi:hypothetical protein
MDGTGKCSGQRHPISLLQNAIELGYIQVEQCVNSCFGFHRNEVESMDILGQETGNSTPIPGSLNL